MGTIFNVLHSIGIEQALIGYSICFAGLDDHSVKAISKSLLLIINGIIATPLGEYSAFNPSNSPSGVCSKYLPEALPQEHFLSLKVKLNEDIVDFILSDKIDKVLFKGEPNDINYKLMKKVIPLSEKNTDPEIVRKKYQNILELCDNSPFCIIYRK